MKSRLSDLAGRIRSGLEDLEAVQKRVQVGWDRATTSGDEHYLDGVALNLHGFYSGLERVFELIAADLDAGRPEGMKWHQELLGQMASDLPGIRPAVISGAIRSRLNAYLGFRHVVRNVYAFKFDPTKIKMLVEDLPSLFDRLMKELLAFAQFLEEVEESTLPQDS